MCVEMPEFEIRIKGHRLVTVQGGEIKIDGKDFREDVESLSSLATILSEILECAQDVKTPKLVADHGRLTEAVPYVKAQIVKNLLSA